MNVSRLGRHWMGEGGLRPRGGCPIKPVGKTAWAGAGAVAALGGRARTCGREGGLAQPAVATLRTEVEDFAGLDSRQDLPREGSNPWI